ncbi:MAG: DUF3592 domain-containing protein [Usitatibacter sp.]
MKKSGSLIGSLLFALVFGAIGLMCSWGIVKSVQGAATTSDWVKVKAELLRADLVEARGSKSITYRATATYLYEFQGRKYESSRIGSDAFGGADNVGSWQQEMGEFLKSAMAEKRPITVWVNPDDPSEAMVDKSIRWGLIGLLAPFALVFGGIGVGGLYSAYRTLTSTEPPPAADGEAKALKGRAPRRSRRGEGEETTGSGPRWLLVLVWNALAWPAALFVLPDALESDNDIGLVVLIFPLIGLFMVWVAAKESYRIWKGAPKAAQRKAMQKKSPGQV